MDARDKNLRDRREWCE